MSDVRARRRVVGWSASAAALLWGRVAAAQQAPDIGRIAEFVRWGGVAASVPVVLAALFVMRVVDGFGDQLSARFSNRRPTIQKVQTTARFLLYIATLGAVLSLSIRLDPTALTVVGGALAFAVGFALRDLVASFIAGLTIIFDRPFQACLSGCHTTGARAACFQLASLKPHPGSDAPQRQQRPGQELPG